MSPERLTELLRDRQVTTQRLLRDFYVHENCFNVINIMSFYES